MNDLKLRNAEDQSLPSQIAAHGSTGSNVEVGCSNKDPCFAPTSNVR